MMMPSESKDVEEKSLVELKAIKSQGWSEIMSTLTTLTRKRGVAKTVVSALVEEVYQWTLEEEFLKDESKVIEVLEFLCELTEGKIFVEVVRARVMNRLANYKEMSGDVPGAKSLLQDLQVESFTTMDTREKTEFIINQMRLILATKDYIRVEIASRKLSKKALDKEGLEDLKINYYHYLLAFHLHEGNYHQASECYAEIMDTTTYGADPELLSTAFTSRSLLAILEIATDETRELKSKLLQVYEEQTTIQNCDAAVCVKNLISSLLNSELTLWPLSEQEEASLKENVIFKDEPHQGGEARFKLLASRILEKNLCILSQTHRRVTLGAISQLVVAAEDEVERVLVSLIGVGTIKAKIDRPAATVVFVDSKNATPVASVDSAGANLSSALSLINSVVHQVARENMLLDQRKVQ
eukprot:GHVH01000234.1.p1 GENE.GHVH01000234.1~~GHVH01000234.1.p1  ORF type:complete len:412 (+),score=81.32 GHVH01000234.1:66-1301(+)